MDVTPRLKAAGVQHLPAKPAPAAMPAPTPTPPATAPAQVPPAPKLAQTPAPVVEPAPTPKITPLVRPVAPWKTGFKAGTKAVGWALVFAGLDCYVHTRLAEELEESIDMSRKGSMSWARHVKARDPSKPVYLTIIVRSEEYSQYIPFLGWMPVAPQLFLAGIELSDRNIDPPSVVIEDHSLNVWRPGKTTTVTYSELRIP